ncbi:AtzE family amidohydrolase [uncultured Alsobacter sp.]|uniref:AtzE family amidohydrolase n=1 Tax=uncultured Alsobacter sp. TaxID=1748258 RepID=UPI0025EFD16F|nr:AtzE family amidohydrolase [uncultured Alsobacter sp.]
MSAERDPIRADASAIAAAVKSGRTTARAVALAHLERIAALDPGLGAFTAVTRERALAEADAVDAAVAAGRDPGPLAGVPYAVKNLFDLAGLVTVAGSKINRADPPPARDATLVERMKGAGAVLLGALNMGEYAYDFTGENAHDGASRNPHDPGHMSGGSSGGSGTAAAAGLATITLGSDTNGSIRVPASFCGLFGLKPTYGRLARGGTFPFVASIDHLGPLARSVHDLALSYDAMQGTDPRDPACTPAGIEPATPVIGQGTQGLRIAVAGGWFARGGMPEAHRAVATVAEALGVSRTVDLPGAQEARAAAYLVTATEAASFHLARLRSRPGDFDPAVRDRLLAGAMAPAAWVAQAHKVRRWWRDRMLAVFQDVDVLIAPATPCRAPLLGQATMTLAGVEMAVRPNIGLFTQPISFAGLPVVAVPVWENDAALPIGVQVIAAPWREDIALRVAAALERDGVCTARVAG